MFNSPCTFEAAPFSPKQEWYLASLLAKRVPSSVTIRLFSEGDIFKRTPIIFLPSDTVFVKLTGESAVSVSTSISDCLTEFLTSLRLSLIAVIAF